MDWTSLGIYLDMCVSSSSISFAIDGYICRCLVKVS